MKYIILRGYLVVVLLPLLFVFCTISPTLTARAQAANFPIFEQGSNGPVVGQIQAWLNQWGYPLAIDEKYGPKTDQAVRSFQANHGLQVDGAVGELTWEKLIMPLGRGSRGPAVSALQKYLHSFFSRSSLAIDGVYGPQTHDMRNELSETFLPVFRGSVNSTERAKRSAHKEQEE
jgi:Putative peptidoglycan binding domain